MSLSNELNPALKDLPVYQPGKPIEDVAREIGIPATSIIKLASNENPLGPSPVALAAMQKVIGNLHIYPDGNAFHIKRKLADKLGMDASNLILGNGSNEIIEFIGHAFMSPGTEVVVSQYSFALYFIVAQLFGAKTVVVPATEYGHDIPAMIDAITPRTKVIFVANPNNPTGTLAAREDIVRLINEVPDNVLLVLDEAYIEFLDDPVDVLPLIRNGTKSNILLMRTFSKIFGLAGLRLGYGIGSPDLIAALEKIRQPFNINAIAQAGALAALDDSEHMLATKRNNAIGLQYLYDAFQRLSLEFVPSAGNFILVRVGDGQKAFVDLQNLGIIVRPMGGYQLPEWIRISVGTPEQNSRCIDALKKVLGR